MMKNMSLLKNRQMNQTLALNKQIPMKIVVDNIFKVRIQTDLVCLMKN